ncbi:MAG: PfkB family carbohydrate kinase [Gordonia sp. (in: high G+C Gram-positive bacteria)]|uniref:PfkB family carbohydrate kinase n=1 Tax=Gordonia sp. (in: high G+C Gram-positive bacteria) TaxID=84139 RepID=UPI003C70A3E7
MTPERPDTAIFTTPDAAAFELDTRPADVVVFGSHLLFGSVGLNAGLPVYAEAGLRCAAVPTVVLSNLPHYPSVQAIDVSAEWIGAALRDLAATGALRSARVVAVGYLAAPEQAHAIADWYRSLDPGTRPPLVLDPTFGDGDVGFYTDPAVAPALRETLLPLAAIVTPNLFELAHLSSAPGRAAVPSSDDPATVVDRARSLPTADDAAVVVTGTRSAPTRIDNVIVSALSVQTVTGREIPTGAKGLGDTFTAALVSAWSTGADLADAVDVAARRVRRAIDSRGDSSDVVGLGPVDETPRRSGARH